MAALLSSVMNTKDRVPQYVAEARAMKIEVLPPDVNESGRRFTVVGKTIRFGLSAVRKVRDNLLEAIIVRSEEHTSELQSRQYLECRLLLVQKILKSHGYILHL